MRRQVIVSALLLPMLWGVPSSARSDTTIYGRAYLHHTWSKQKFEDTTEGSQISSDLKDETSYIGFRGSEALGNGQSAVWQYEFGVDMADGPTIGGQRKRLAYVGFRGGWGQFTVGTQTHPYYLAVGSGVRNAFDALNRGKGYLTVSTQDEFNDQRDNNMLLYETPSFSGLVGDVALITDGPSGASGVDEYQLALRYDKGPLSLGAGYRFLDKDSTDCGLNGGSDCDSASTWGTSATYKFGSGLSLVGQYSTFDDGDENNWWSTDVYVTYEFAGRHRVGGGGWAAKNKDGLEQDYSGWILGWRYSFSKRSQVFLEYGSNDFDPGQSDPAVKHENDLSLGMRHNF